MITKSVNMMRVEVEWLGMEEKLKITKAQRNTGSQYLAISLGDFLTMKFIIQKPEGGRKDEKAAEDDENVGKGGFLGFFRFWRRSWC